MEIVGDKIILRSITSNDTALILKWRNDPSVSQYFFFQEELTEKMHLNWLKNKIDNGKAIQFIIYEKTTNEPIGTAYIDHIDNDKKIGEYGFYLATNKYRGQGLGTESAKLSLQFAWDNGFHAIYGRVRADNIAALKSDEKNGFKKISKDDFPFSRNIPDDDVVYLVVTE